MANTTPPHSNTPTYYAGYPIAEATHFLILLHGRYAGGQNQIHPFLPFLKSFPPHIKVAIVAPEADNRDWFPKFHYHTIAENEPYLSAAVARVEREIVRIEQERGVDRTKIAVGGFSQGACLTAQYVLKHPGKYWGVFVLSGSIPGKREYDIPIEGTGVVGEDFPRVDLLGIKVFVGCGDSDLFIDAKEVNWVAWAFGVSKANVDKRIYGGMNHMICQDEFDGIRDMLVSSA